MPYKSEKIAINNLSLDKRVKIHPDKYDEIRELYIAGGHTHRSLAKKYGVTKGTIAKIVSEEQAKRIREQSIISSETYREKLKIDSSRREERNKAMMRHRKYKKELMDKGLIGVEEKDE